MKSKKIKSVKGGSGKASEDQECNFTGEAVKKKINSKCKSFFNIIKPGSSGTKDSDYLRFYLDLDISDVYSGVIVAEYAYKVNGERKYIDPFYVNWYYTES